MLKIWLSQQRNVISLHDTVLIINELVQGLVTLKASGIYPINYSLCAYVSHIYNLFIGILNDYLSVSFISALNKILVAGDYDNLLHRVRSVCTPKSSVGRFNKLQSIPVNIVFYI